MLHGGLGDLHVGRVDELAGGVELVVAEVGGAEDVVPKNASPPVAGSAWGWAVMGEVRAPSKSSISIVAMAVSRRWGSPVAEGQEPPAVPEHVGVGRAVDRLGGPRGWRGAHLGRELAGPHPPVAVGGGPAPESSTAWTMPSPLNQW